MNPRKSSTSSARIPFDRPRYLGIEVAGEPFPPPSPRLWETWLRAALTQAREGDLRFRFVRAEARRAIVAVAHTDAARARDAWNVGQIDGMSVGLATRRTWGTLVGAKRWARGRPRPQSTAA